MRLTGPHENQPYFSFLSSIIPPSTHHRRIDGRLHTVGDTVLIPNLGYNGTILGFTHHFVVVLPHDYGPPIRRLSRNLRSGRGISLVQWSHLHSIGISINDTHRIYGGTFAHCSRPNYNRTIDNNSLAEYFIYHTTQINGENYHHCYKYQE